MAYHGSSRSPALPGDLSWIPGTEGTEDGVDATHLSECVAEMRRSMLQAKEAIEAINKAKVDDR